MAFALMLWQAPSALSQANDAAGPAGNGAEVPNATANNGADATSALAAAKERHARVELTALRTPTSATYVNPDGTLSTESYAGVVRAKSDEDKWIPIDTDVEKNSGAFEPTATPYNAQFSDGGDKTVGTVTSEDDSTVKVGWPTKLPAPTVDGDELTYPDAVSGGGDLLVQSRVDGFSYSMVLDHAPAADAPQIEYRIPLTFDGLTTRHDDDGSVALMDDGHQVGVMTPPVMWDVDNAGIDGEKVPVDSTIDGDGSHQTFVLTPDMDYLRDPSTTYPVTVDPQFSLSAAGDTYASTTSASGAPNATDLRVGSFTLGVTQYKSYLGFDLSSLFSTGGTITDAKLQLSNFGTGDCNGTAIRMSRVTSAFSIPTIAQPNLPTITSAGSTTNTTAYGKTACAGEGPAIWDATQVVNDAQTAGSSTLGLALTADNNIATTGYRQYRSLENGDLNKVPTLTVSWLPPPPTPVADTALCAQPAQDNDCAADPTQSSWSDAPTLDATTTDPLGLNLAYTFEVWASDGTNPIGTAPVGTNVIGGLLSGLLATFTPQLTNGGLYQYRVKVSNGLTSTIWSAWHIFSTTLCNVLQSLPNTTDLDPVTGAIVQVLNWSYGDVDVSQTVEPAGFDAPTATDDQLEFYGLPARPTTPLDPNDPESQDAWDSWHSAVDSPDASHMQTLGPNSLCALPQNGVGGTTDWDIDPGHTPDDDERLVTGSRVSPSWAGEVARAHNDYKYITGEFIVPTYTTGGSSRPHDAHSTWVGLGGYGLTRNLMQNGVGSDWTNSSKPYAWWEILSPSTNSVLDPVVLSTKKFPVATNNDIVVSTQYLASKKQAKFFFQNKTRGHTWQTTVTVTGHLDSSTSGIPGHISRYYDGASAEAIDERPIDACYWTYNRQHTPVQWEYVRVGNTTSTSAGNTSTIRSVAHDSVSMAQKVPGSSPTRYNYLETLTSNPGRPGWFIASFSDWGTRQKFPGTC